MFEFDERLGTVQITIGDNSIKSFRDGEARDVQSAFVEAATKRAFDVRVQPFKAKVYDGSTFLQSNYGVGILDLMSKYDFLAFFTDKRVLIRSFNLRGSAAMIYALRKCAAQERQLHPSDPFSR